MLFNTIHSSGQSGIDFAREALSHGHSLTVYVRSPEKLPRDISDHANVNVIRGGFDADLETIRPAITSGAEAIVSTAGPIPGNNGTGTVGLNRASIANCLEA
jgi:putative NADH-flavin reductase